MNVREKVLKEALNCVNGEREKQYGNPEDNFRRIADLWSTYLTSLFEDEEIVIDIDPIDVAKMMILFKIARSNGDKDKMDNYVDIIGYGACAAEIFEGQERNDIQQKRIEVFPCDHIKVVEECRNCDYAEKCMGTGVCLKEEEKKCIKKDDPDFGVIIVSDGELDLTKEERKAISEATERYIKNTLAAKKKEDKK